MAELTTQRLNELLQQVIEERNLANGWTTFDVPDAGVRPDHRSSRAEVTVGRRARRGHRWTVGTDDDQRVRLGIEAQHCAPTPRGARAVDPRDDRSRDPQPSFDHECYQCGRPIT